MTVMAKMNCRKRRTHKGTLERRDPEEEVVEERENLERLKAILIGMIRGGCGRVGEKGEKSEVFLKLQNLSVGS